MGPRTHGTTGRIVAGGTIAVFGLVLLIGAYTYRLDQAEAVGEALTGPLLESLSLVLMALAGVFIVVGLYVAANALRRALKAQQTGIGHGFSDPGG